MEGELDLPPAGSGSSSGLDINQLLNTSLQTAGTIVTALNQPRPAAVPVVTPAVAPAILPTLNTAPGAMPKGVLYALIAAGVIFGGLLLLQATKNS